MRTITFALILGPLILLAFLSSGCGSDDSPGRQADSPDLEVSPQSAGGQGQVVTVSEVEPVQTYDLPTETPAVPVAAVVNGQDILLADYERRLEQQERALAEQGLDIGTEEGEETLDLVGYDVLDGMIDYILIEQAAVQLGTNLTEEELTATMEEDIAAGGGPAAFEEWLVATGLTRDDYADMLRQSLLSQRILDLITADLPEIAEQVHVRQIVVEDETEAEEILALLQKGSDFATLARERSQDLATSDAGGELGWLARGLVEPDLERVAFSLQPGEFSGAMPLDGGFYVIQVVERDNERQLSPDMSVDLRLSIFDEWLEEQRATAEIERFAGE